ncbi:MAG: type IV-A pilus assembly ATPase PilB [Rudaea sp.]|uniref:type IV-A pilus assembly ATPase PilB n=1 Tax=unclassified Rudaea TaxID=2627037 RepID=UPI0010F9CAB4|nr:MULTISPECIES: type IV-A pilus assembly ATPase PilB [unclassified Rudaea]MBN8887372.1 type IV-A pilus assembly ATPase PilB [Rudaea sp.]MBR0347227.1 type IV-A pilus assembly ATPase PilB [Rudaea sp.]
MNAPDTAATPTLTGLSGVVKRLVMQGLLSENDARRVNDASLKQKIPVTSLLLERNLVSSARLALANSEEFGVPLLDAESIDLAQIPQNLISEDLANKHQVLPLFRRGPRVYVATADPTNARALDDVKFHAKTSVEPVLIDTEALSRLIDQAYSMGTSSFDALDDVAGGLEKLVVGDFEEDSDSGHDAKGNDTPVVKFVNKVLVDAIKRGASDIHFEPFENHYRVRFRMDGILRAVTAPPSKMAARIASRLKVMSGLDISERRIPQDGRIKLNLSKTKAVDFRVSSCPTLFGEKLVLRILDASVARLGIDKLGYDDDQKELFVNAIQKPYGMVVVTGPTGSGKTVSLYTALNILNVEGRNISTVEDPIEIRLQGVNQVQQNVKRGMTFAVALRAFLRQDPDVIMVGEIRDLETAEIAVKAAQTGHMVLSTLHTNDAPQTVSRLMNMGIAPYNITSALTLVVAQRLARRLHECKKPLALPPESLLSEGFTQEDLKDLQIYDAIGCSMCNEGYKGRTGIYQVMPINEPITKIILKGGNMLDIAAAAKTSGVRDLRGSALLKVKQRVTSLAEINRVTKD